MSDRANPPKPDVLLRLLPRLLRPLVRLLIQSGVTFQAFSEMASALYVDVAGTDLLSDDKTRTDSRISIMTGVHRKEIRRLRLLPREQAKTPPAVTLGAALIARWLGGAPWVDEDGRPRPLPRTALGGDPSFDALVETATKDVRPRTIVDEWLRQGVVRLDVAERVVLNEEAFVPRPGGEEQLFYFARNLHDHIAAAVANISAVDTAPFLDRSLHYDALSPEAAVRLQTVARNAAQRLLVQVNREAARIADADGASKRPDEAPKRRVNLGVYLFSEDDTPGTES